MDESTPDGQELADERHRDDFQLFIVDDTYIYSPHQTETRIPGVDRFINPVSRAYVMRAGNFPGGLLAESRKMLDALFWCKWEAGSGEYDGVLLERKWARFRLICRKASDTQRRFSIALVLATFVAVILASRGEKTILDILGATGAIVSAIALYWQLFTGDSDK
jgi:hypothetical protein